MNSDILARYLSLWSDPAPDRDLTPLDEITTEQVRFRDPINDLYGREQLKHLFRDAANAVAAPNVEISGIAWADPNRAFVQWRYAGKLTRLGGKPWSVDGMSEILFLDGRIISHRDFWDLSSGLFEYFPWIGSLFRCLRQRLRLRQGGS